MRFYSLLPTLFSLLCVFAVFQDTPSCMAQTTTPEPVETLVTASRTYIHADPLTAILTARDLAHVVAKMKIDNILLNSQGIVSTKTIKNTLVGLDEVTMISEFGPPNFSVWVAVWAVEVKVVYIPK